jgi:hypothetical protein
MKRKILSFIILLTVVSKTALKAQDCASVNKFTSFHGISFGQKIPVNVLKYCPNPHYDSVWKNILYSMYVENVKGKNSTYENWFHFIKDFYFIMFHCSSDGRLYDITLSKSMMLNEDDRTALMNNSYPADWIDLRTGFNELFGQHSNYTYDPYNFFGCAYEETWECSQIKITLNFSYTKSYAADYSIKITNTDLEKQSNLERYTKP